MDNVKNDIPAHPDVTHNQPSETVTRPATTPPARGQSDLVVLRVIQEPTAPKVVVLSLLRG